MRNKRSAKRVGYLREIFILYYSIRDSRTPWYAKLTAFFALAYLISPIDLIPDFIPIAGYLDDLVIVPLLLHIAYTLLPAAVQETGRVKAWKHIVRLRIAFFIFLLFVIGLLVGIFFLMERIFHHL